MRAAEAMELEVSPSKATMTTTINPSQFDGFARNAISTGTDQTSQYLSRKPLAVELFCGCFGWSAGWIAEGGRAIGFDLEHLPHHGPIPENCELVIQDVLTLHGSQFRNADIILASPPCTQYSYLAMPWSRSQNPNNSKAAKALRLQMGNRRAG